VSACGAEIEDMEHILLKCESAHRRVVWDMCREAWPNGQEAWPEISKGAVLACNSIAFNPKQTAAGEGRKESERRTSGRSQLAQELIRESAYLIWSMRCERAVGKRESAHTEREVSTRWQDRVVERFKADRALVLRAGKPKKRTQDLYMKWKDMLNVERALDKIQEGF
jgi:hypothetical protein